MYLRILCKIHVSGSINQHPYVSQDTLQDPCLRFMSQHFYFSGSSARSISPDSCLTILISQDPLQDPCLRIHVFDSCLSIHQYGTSARSMSPGSCLSIFASQDSLQDPCLRIHVSASLYLRSLYKIHVSDSCLSVLQYGSSARSMSPDSASICISGSSARSMSPIHVSASSYLRVLCKIHVSGFMSQHLYISGSSARSMSPDPYISIHHPSICISGSSARSMSPGSCLSIHVYLRILYKTHVFGVMSQHLRISGSSARSMSPGSCLSIPRVFCGPAQGKLSDQDPLYCFAQAKRTF